MILLRPSLGKSCGRQFSSASRRGLIRMARMKANLPGAHQPQQENGGTMLKLIEAACQPPRKTKSNFEVQSMKNYTSSQFFARPSAGSPGATDQQNRRRRNRTLIWREGDFREVFIRVAASKDGWVWRAFEGKTLLDAGLGEMKPGTSRATGELIAARKGTEWVRKNIPGAHVRIRSLLERHALFGGWLARR